ncbi:MAG: sulfite oxidase-like oxidoreductase [Candidatus Aramenus sulfurataquae]|jgi:DMSO/TMAO reductase YedYZ molybdopterin-dependent catalytic subunit|uniref:Sulfite oxidase-like oxidoreductase n=2 Tax=Candidatus Aramenus sulfurataquae TaxID=1326980 RepID=A0AAE3FK14_9CREN|nr:sulfite oxidase-like oxidoreductase [Candidatus Aramenus sulfurataquae]
METQVPKGQKYIKKFIYYAALGVPEVDVSKYRLTVTGLVENKLEFSYEELLKMIDVDYVRDFHCVTGWSVKDVRWEGIKIRRLADMAKVKENAKWAVLYSLDGYTSVVPVEDALHEDAIIALRMNGKPLTLESGFPARPFIPHLYGWKSAKWLTEIEFVDKYVDGFWEERGYHERGNVWEEERFKGNSGRHTPKRPIL